MGLTHLALTVRDARRAFEFYRRAFGAKATYRSPGWIEFQTPGAQDIISLVEADGAARKRAGKMGGIQHFGFRLRRPDDIEQAVVAAESAGGKLLRRGEFSPGHPYAYVEDLDGYEIELWFE